MTAEALLAQRRQKDEFFRTHPQSPLTDAQQQAFTGLRYYPPNAALDLVLPLHPFDTPDSVEIATTTDEVRHYTRLGEIRFEVEGAPARLTVYETNFGLFLPFVDAGVNVETYGAGRYLDPDELPGGRLHVDFNLGYNPYCVYASAYSCPLTPFENRLAVAIRAGEMLPEGDWVALGH